MTLYLKKYPLTLVLAAVICFLSFFNPPRTQLDTVDNFDKIVHLCMYFALACVLWSEYLKTHERLNATHLLWGAIMAPILMSGTIELLQAYATTYRSGDWWDFAANCAGVLLAIPFSLYITRPFVERRKAKRS